eukprot:1183075-Prorocentrum_minimum.AAC.4
MDRCRYLRCVRAKRAHADDADDRNEHHHACPDAPVKPAAFASREGDEGYCATRRLQVGYRLGNAMDDETRKRTVEMKLGRRGRRAPHPRCPSICSIFALKNLSTPMKAHVYCDCFLTTRVPGTFRGETKSDDGL